jgi:hypothetical protein
MCGMDSQCAGVNGRCNNGGALFCLCTSDTCADDKACPSGQTCACHGSPYDNAAGNHCVAGNCRIDADCGSGGWCSPTYSQTGCGSLGGYYCHTPKDQCINDSDCADGGVQSDCGYDTSLGYWLCIGIVACP